MNNLALWLMTVLHGGGSVAAPVNSIAPSLSTNTPVIGTAITYTPGTWTGSPSVVATIQRYVSGAWADVTTVTTTYTPTSADFGYALRVIEAATNAGGAASANSSATYMTAYTETALWVRASMNTYQVSNGTTAASADTDPVGYIADVRGTAVAAIQATSTKRPLLKLAILNSQPVLRFDGTNDTLAVTSIALDTYFTLFAVVTTTTAKPMFIEHGADSNSNPGFYCYGTAGKMLLVNRDGAAHNAEGTANWLGASAAIVMAQYSGSLLVRKNGSTATNVAITGTARSDSALTTQLNIFSRNQASLFSSGDLAELIIVNSALDTTAQNVIGARLAALYNLTWA